MREGLVLGGVQDVRRKVGGFGGGLGWRVLIIALAR